MTDPTSIALMGASLIATLVIAAVALLKGWRGWLDYKQLELASRIGEPDLAPTGGRIEIADLKERVRKLEAIAAGIEL
ncbi:MAG: hypothetical protein ABR588_11945 [Sphingomicrobium sp.]|nr:hypothetical protein [Sphingomonadales bacterium]